MVGPAVSDRAVPSHGGHRRGRAAARRGSLLDRPARPRRDQLGRDAGGHPRCHRGSRPLRPLRKRRHLRCRGMRRNVTDAARASSRCADIDHRLHQARIGASHEQERRRRLTGGGRGAVRTPPRWWKYQSNQRHMAVRREGNADDPARTTRGMVVTAWANSPSGLARAAIWRSWRAFPESDAAVPRRARLGDEPGASRIRSRLWRSNDRASGNA